jgi:hypothetical protein
VATRDRYIKAFEEYAKLALTKVGAQGLLRTHKEADLERMRLRICGPPDAFFLAAGDQFDMITRGMDAEDRCTLKEQSVSVVFEICLHLFLYFINVKPLPTTKFTLIAKNNALMRALGVVFVPKPATHTNPEVRYLDLILDRFGFMLEVGMKELIVHEYAAMSTAGGSLWTLYTATCETKSLFKFYSDLNAMDRGLPNFAALACVLSSIPASQASVERGFFRLARFKSKLTNRLAPASTEARFIIGNNVPMVNDDGTLERDYLDDFNKSYVDKAFLYTGTRAFRSFLN